MALKWRLTSCCSVSAELADQLRRAEVGWSQTLPLSYSKKKRGGGLSGAMAGAATASATAAATVNGNALSSSSASSMPMPRSPPKLPDLYGKHRLQAQLQSLNREITFLEDELRTLDSLQLASRSCKEVDEFVASNQDPMTPKNRRARKCRLCKRMWSLLVSTQKLILNIPCIVYSLLINSRPSCNISIFCCSSGCSIQLKTPRCSCSISRKCRDCCLCCCWCNCRNCLQTLCCNPCCARPSISCPDCSCRCCKWSFPCCTRICECASKCLQSSCRLCC